MEQKLIIKVTIRLGFRLVGGKEDIKITKSD